MFFIFSFIEANPLSAEQRLSAFVRDLEGQKQPKGTIRSSLQNRPVQENPQESFEINPQTDFSFANIPTSLYDALQGTPEPFQVEVYGGDHCPYCVKAKNLTMGTFGKERLKFHDVYDNKYKTASFKILKTVGKGNYRLIPRVSIIIMKDGKYERLYIGGFDDFERYVDNLKNTKGITAKRETVNLKTITDENSGKDFTQYTDLETLPYSREKVSLTDVVKIEVFDYGQPNAYHQVANIFGPVKTQLYQTRDNREQGTPYLAKLRDLLAQAGRSDFSTVPAIFIITVVDNRYVRYFLGDYRDFEQFVRSSRNS